MVVKRPSAGLYLRWRTRAARLLWLGAQSQNGVVVLSSPVPSRGW